MFATAQTSGYIAQYYEYILPVLGIYKNMAFCQVLWGMVMKAKTLLCLGMLVLVTPALSGCWLLAAGGAGAYGGYKAKEEGYTLRNPVKKERSSEQQEED